MLSAVFYKRILIISCVGFIIIICHLLNTRPAKEITTTNKLSLKEILGITFVKPTDYYLNYKLNRYKSGKWRGLSDKEIKKMSTLGRILYLDEKPPQSKSSKTFTILVWKYGKTTENRHLKNWGSKYIDPFQHCSVKNCKVTFEDKDFKNADLVIIHMHQMKGKKELPLGNRTQNQIWAFSADESPYHIFLYSGSNKLTEYNGVFNWSMTYRHKSDIPVPYGRTVALKTPDESRVDDLDTWKNSKKKDVWIAILGSNCGSNNHRWEYVKELQNEIPVDRYGGCGTLKCPGHFNRDCKEIGDYMFYLAFENSNCEEYITEKLWWNAYAKNSIPIIMGDKESNLAKLLPPHSYINVENFVSPIDLAAYIRYLMLDPSELQLYFQWKKYFQVIQEHAYFQTESFHYCRACEALNYNERKFKVYDKLEDIWSTNSCYPDWRASARKG